MRLLRLLGVNSTGLWNQTGRERTELVEIGAVDWDKCASHWGNLSPLVESASPYPLEVAVETRQDEDGKLCFQLTIGANEMLQREKKHATGFVGGVHPKPDAGTDLTRAQAVATGIFWHGTFYLPRWLQHFLPFIMQRICTKVSSPGYRVQQG